MLSDFERILKENAYSLQNFKKGVLINFDLKDCDVVIVGAPHADIIQEEISILREFVERGGGLFIMGSASIETLLRARNMPQSKDIKIPSILLSKFRVNLDSLNQLASEFGIIFEDKIITAGKNFIENFNEKYPVITQFFSHPIVQGVKELIIASGVPLKIKGEMQSIAISDPDTIPPNCCVLASIQFGKGRVVALSSYSLFTRLSILKIPLRLGLYKPDHVILGLNIMNWLSHHV